MRVFINDEEYQGTPEEINTFLSLREDKKINDTPFTEEDFKPLIDESNDLRRKLSRDPNYNPFGGVVPSKESEQDIDIKETPPIGDEDTGVTIA